MTTTANTETLKGLIWRTVNTATQQEDADAALACIAATRLGREGCLLDATQLLAPYVKRLLANR